MNEQCKCIAWEFIEKYVKCATHIGKRLKKTASVAFLIQMNYCENGRFVFKEFVACLQNQWNF